jgi:hypothetical protein
MVIDLPEQVTILHSPSAQSHSPQSVATALLNSTTPVNSISQVNSTTQQWFFLQPAYVQPPISQEPTKWRDGIVFFILIMTAILLAFFVWQYTKTYVNRLLNCCGITTQVSRTQIIIRNYKLLISLKYFNRHFGEVSEERWVAGQPLKRLKHVRWAYKHNEFFSTQVSDRHICQPLVTKDLLW